jgi:predicted glycosyltransferase
MFRAMIRDLQQSHDVIVTSRPLANTGELLRMHKIEHTVVGSHYGRSGWRKACGFPVRVTQLMQFLKHKRIDVAVSQSSFHSPVVARLMGIRSIYLNDNEHAAGNIPAFACADSIMVPEFLSKDSLRKQGARLKKVTHYPGVKEGIYLWEYSQRLSERAKSGDAATRPRIYIRPEPWTAQYYNGPLNFMDDLVAGLQDRAEVTILPRTEEQYRHYAGPAFSRVRALSGVMDIQSIAGACDLFIGAGGTMTREMAVLGIPTISVYQEALLDVDRFLIEEGACVHCPQLGADEALAFLDAHTRGLPNPALLAKGRAAYDMIKEQVTNENA